MDSSASACFLAAAEITSLTQTSASVSAFPYASASASASAVGGADLSYPIISADHTRINMKRQKNSSGNEVLEGSVGVFGYIDEEKETGSSPLNSSSNSNCIDSTIGTTTSSRKGNSSASLSQAVIRQEAIEAVCQVFLREYF